MNWDRVEAARRRARILLGVASLAVIVLVFVLIAAPRFTDPCFGCHVSEAGIPTSTLLIAIGIGGVVFGFAWMWRIYKAPTKYDGATWRYRDH